MSGWIVVSARIPMTARRAGSLAHGVTSKASITMEVPADAGFFDPVASIVNVWLPAAKPDIVKTVDWGASVEENVSKESVTTFPSRVMRAIPVWGPRKPIQLTDVPVKVNVAWSP
jgi:hypothetical protein